MPHISCLIPTFPLELLVQDGQSPVPLPLGEADARSAPGEGQIPPPSPYPLPRGEVI
jgi:hypothetical protein